AGLLARSLLIGARFDLRLVLILLLPFLPLGGIRLFSPFRHRVSRIAWQVYFGVAFLLVQLVYVFDAGHTAYLGARIEASVFGFLANPDISARMVWQSYPVIWIALGLGLLTWGYALLISRFVARMSGLERFSSRLKGKVGLGLLTFFLVAVGLYGRLGQYPLRWSDAFFSHNAFASSLALNPVLNLYDTLDFRASRCDIDLVRKYYPRMAAYLGVEKPDPESLTFARTGTSRAKVRGAPPNVVVVLLESFAPYKMSLFGNPLPSTPFFDAMARGGLLFDHCFAPHASTARGVFALLTGIPDVELGWTSSRNPSAVNQRSILNDFAGCKKFYFLGGSASWANIRALLSHNIDDLKIYEEGDFTSPREDVWGISDLMLFKEANDVLRGETRPFFAFIQTSGAHRPFTIPKNNWGFKMMTASSEELKKFGFNSLEEFNSFRFLDHSLGFFFDQARKEKYFENTIFVLLADHGISAYGGDHWPRYYTELTLTRVHIPLVFYAPKLIPRPQRLTRVASQIDLLPTIAGLARRRYTNTTLGRDLLDPRSDDVPLAFINLYGKENEIAVMNNDFYFSMWANHGGKRLHALKSPSPMENVVAQFPQVVSVMEEETEGIYQTALYMLTHNKRKIGTGSGEGVKSHFARSEHDRAK
ncbi:MAG: LTA synthase family protein, partial [Elusimicrobia bacterium]|nr:LTA synthase family protein [Candidatus Obscuribacterium magneticum]